ncbi:MAG: TonB-dependent receptor [Desulfobulbus sp.]|nr:TonB-dependent receptor [Desulfobulbus sp.]
MREKKNTCKTTMAIVMVCAGTLIEPCHNIWAANGTTEVNGAQKTHYQQILEGDTVMLPSLFIEEQAIETGVDVVNKNGLDIYGGAAQLNPYTAISMLPGVDIRSGDGYGMLISHRIRGKADRNIGETMEGLPLKGIGPGGGLSTMMDMENLESITVEKGAVDVDSGLGYGSDNGMVDMHILQPKENIGIIAKQGFGSEDFLRSFLRVDTGTINDIAKFFISASYTDAEKWKGAGDSPDGRKNAAFGLASPDAHDVKWSIDGVYNKQKSYDYRSLTYDQSQNLSRYHDYDYNERLTGIPSLDSAYYGYNYADFTTSALLGKLQVPVSLMGKGMLTFKPYFLHDEGNSYSGKGATVTDWLVEHDTFGGVFEYEQKIGIADVKMGYWYGEDEPPGPPTSRKTRTINADGTLSFTSWERLVGVADNTHFNSPFLSSEFQFGRFSINTGVRYLWWTTPSLTFYDATGIGDVSYKQALSQATTEYFNVNGDAYGVFLPKVGGNYSINDTVSLRASYGRNYNTPQYSIGSSLLSYYKKGKTEAELQDIWANKIKPEESDNFDIGMKVDLGRFSWDTDLFYSLMKNTAGTYYDNYLGEAYNQNAGESQAYGIEMAFGYQILDGLKANLALTYNRNEFTEDFFTADGATIINAKGNQIPERPEFMANMSLLWEVGDFSICPMVKYVGPRYADVENKYKMDDFFLVDMDITWKLVNKKNHDVTLKLGMTNLLDEEYIATSSAGDQTTEISGLSFTVGAPRTIFASIQFEM